MKNKLKSKLAAIGSTEIVIIVLVSVVLVICSGLGLKTIIGNENSGIIGSVKSRIMAVPEQIENQQGIAIHNNGNGQGGGNVAPVSSYGTLTKSWDISQNQDGSVTMDYYDDTKTAVISGEGIMSSNQLVLFDLLGAESMDDLSDEQFMASHVDFSQEQPTFMFDYPAETIIVEDGITTLPNCVFSCLTTVRTVILADTITSFENRCFENCTSLVNLSLPSHLVSIDGECFYGCTSLKELVFPESLESVYEYPLWHTGIEKITILGNTDFYDLYQPNTSLTIIYGPNVTNPDYPSSQVNKVVFSQGFNSLRLRMLYYTNVTEVYLPSSITNIPEECFTSLQSEHCTIYCETQAVAELVINSHQYDSSMTDIVIDATKF